VRNVGWGTRGLCSAVRTAVISIVAVTVQLTVVWHTVPILVAAVVSAIPASKN
jgi:hypothetical protein